MRFTYILLLFILMACNRADKNSLVDEFIVLGHTYQWHLASNRVDYNLEKKDLKRFKGIWLGGDLCSETTKEQQTLEYLEQLFNISSPHTLWAVGNHDIRNGNTDWIERYTQKDLYHKYDYNVLRVITLNTQTEHPRFKDNCEWRKSQFDFLNSELELALNDSGLKHLILFTHQSIWDDAEQPLNEIDTIGNQNASWINFICDVPSNFKQSLLDPLIKIQNMGIQVHCIAGDGGQYLKTFYATGESGIKYYATGINNSVIDTEDPEKINLFDTAPDSVLIFQYHHENAQLDSKFIPLSSL